MKMNKKCLLFFVFLVFPAFVVPSELWDLYSKGNDSYQRGDYQSAISSYEKILSAGVASSQVHYNLANSYFRHSQLGEAIFHLRMADALSPHDADILFNLQYARSKTLDKIEEKSLLTSRILPFFSSFSEKIAYIFFGASTLMACLMSILLLFVQTSQNLSSKGMRWIQKAAFIGVFYFGSLVVRSEFLENPFGVIKQKTKVYSAAGVNNIVLFSLHKGAEFTLVERLERPDLSWIRLELADGKQGWVPEKRVIVKN